MPRAWYTSALVVHFPPAPVGNNPSSCHVPEFLKEWPVASVNYRWEPATAVSTDCGGRKVLSRLRWPTPVHDAASAFQWILENLGPPNDGRGDILVYGSHLGASLAASLSLTETRPADRFGVRGLAAYNGIYDWTMFLPDHKIYQATRSKPARTQTAAIAAAATVAAGSQYSSHINDLRKRLRPLFGTPSHLFDPFASPSLFFHSPGLVIPKLFHMKAIQAAILSATTGYEKLFARRLRAPQRSLLTFPPPGSALGVPDTLLLHDISSRIKGCGGTKNAETTHGFEVQAKDLASYMRRSFDKVQVSTNYEMEEDESPPSVLAQMKIQVVRLEVETADLGLDQQGQEVVTNWMRQRLRM